MNKLDIYRSRESQISLKILDILGGNVNQLRILDYSGISHPISVDTISLFVLDEEFYFRNHESFLEKQIQRHPGFTIPFMIVSTNPSLHEIARNFAAKCANDFNKQLFVIPFEIDDDIDRKSNAILSGLAHIEKNLGKTIKYKLSVAKTSDRIRTVMDYIESLRINDPKADEIIEELHSIDSELASYQDQTNEHIKEVALQRAVQNAIAAVTNLAELLGDKTTQKVLLSGMVAILVGGTGAASVTALGLVLAAFEGKDALMKMLNTRDGDKSD